MVKPNTTPHPHPTMSNRSYINRRAEATESLRSFCRQGAAKRDPMRGIDPAKLVRRLTINGKVYFESHAGNLYPTRAEAIEATRAYGITEFEVYVYS